MRKTDLWCSRKMSKDGSWDRRSREWSSWRSCRRPWPRTSGALSRGDPSPEEHPVSNRCRSAPPSHNDLQTHRHSVTAVVALHWYSAPSSNAMMTVVTMIMVRGKWCWYWWCRTMMLMTIDPKKKTMMLLLMLTIKGKWQWWRLWLVEDSDNDENDVVTLVMEVVMALWQRLRQK